MRVEHILVFDSGLGGLTVLNAIRSARPGLRFTYVADDARFPYGAMSDQALLDRVMALMEGLIPLHAPDMVVIACNTASTLVMPPLRARFSLPFVGTVPAIKPAAAATRSGHVSVLGTPGTVARDYTHGLIRDHAAGLSVKLVASWKLAGLAEAWLAGEAVDDEAVAAEIAGCFHQDDAGARTDAVVLACTHYPWLLPVLERLAPWPVAWIDPAPAIARRVVSLLGEARAGCQGVRDGGGEILFTSGGTGAAGLAGLFGRLGLVPGSFDRVVAAD